MGIFPGLNKRMERISRTLQLWKGIVIALVMVLIVFALVEWRIM